MGVKFILAWTQLFWIASKMKTSTLLKYCFLGEKTYFHYGKGVPPTWGKFINHSSKRPNVRPKVFINSEKMLEILFVAKSDIAIGTQLVYTYGSKFRDLKPCVASCTKCGMGPSFFLGFVKVN